MIPARETKETSWDNLVAYDIKTTGLNKNRDKITVVCLYGYGCGQGIVFNFLRKDQYEQQRSELIAILDAAPRLASFNGIRFDAPFLQAALNVDQVKVQDWIVKSFDVWEICKTLLRHTFKMDELLRENGFECKLGSGLDAIEWAKDQKKWPMLEKYCMQDARLTWEVSRLTVIKIPRTANPENGPSICIVKTSDSAFELIYPPVREPIRQHRRVLLKPYTL